MANIPVLGNGEFYFADDSKQLFIGSVSGNVLVTGSATTKISVVVDFGFALGNEGDVARASVSAPWVTADSIILCSLSAISTADHDPDDGILESIQAYAENLVPGVGFDVVVVAPQNSWGRYEVTAVGM